MSMKKIILIAVSIIVVIGITVSITIYVRQPEAPITTDKDRQVATDAFLSNDYEKAKEPDYTFK